MVSKIYGEGKFPEVQYEDAITSPRSTRTGKRGKNSGNFSLQRFYENSKYQACGDTIRGHSRFHGQLTLNAGIRSRLEETKEKRRAGRQLLPSTQYKLCF